MTGSDAPSAANTLLIERFYTAFGAGDGEGMAACYAPDAHFADPVFPDLRGSEPGEMWRMLTSAPGEVRDYHRTIKGVDRFGRPGKGNDKGKVEGLVGYARRNFLVPIPVFESFEALNTHLLECCRRRRADCLRGHDGTIGAYK